MITKHTPGPWNVEVSSFYSPGYNGYPPVVTKEAADICELNASLREADANARPIAAAPDLLDALKELLDRADAEGDITGLPEYDNARKAIAKATKGAP